jgi:hypothetical protein
LHLGLPLLRRLLRQLESEQMLRPEGSETWALTDLGRQAVEQGSYPRARSERRTFYFSDSEQRPGAPYFLHFTNPPPVLPWSGTESWRFEPSDLLACIDRPPEWKQRFGFPLEVRQILTAADAEASAFAPEAWQRVILDRPEHLAVALVLAPASSSSSPAPPPTEAENRQCLLGFAVQLDGWTLQSAEPVFVMETVWPAVFPELAMDPLLEHWRRAWRVWCQPRSLPAAEAEACTLERQGHRLRVMAPRRLVERLRAARSDVFKGEAWLLAGAGRLRTAAQVELVESHA